MQQLARWTWPVMFLGAAGLLSWAAEPESSEKEPSPPAAARDEDESKKVDDELQKDLERLQGTWQRVSIDADGNVQPRQLKVIKGNQETLTNYDSSGDVSRRHTVEFKLERSGDVKIFTFAAPGRLDDPKAAISYIYKLDEDVFYDVPGLLTSNRRQYSNQPAIYEWTRVRRPLEDDDDSPQKK